MLTHRAYGIHLLRPNKHTALTEHVRGAARKTCCIEIMLPYLLLKGNPRCLCPLLPVSFHTLPEPTYLLIHDVCCLMQQPYAAASLTEPHTLQESKEGDRIITQQLTHQTLNSGKVLYSRPATSTAHSTTGAAHSTTGGSAQHNRGSAQHNRGSTQHNKHSAQHNKHSTQHNRGSTQRRY
jgi:hypothetical protein